MAKKPPNQGKPWTATDVRTLEKLADGNTPTRVIGLTMGRTPEAIYSKASARGYFAGGRSRQTNLHTAQRSNFGHS